MFVILASFWSACADNREERVFEEDGQRFRIVSAYEGQSRYLDSAMGDPGSGEALWNEHVVDAYREDCLAGEYEQLAEAYLAEPMMDFRRLPDSIETLRRSDIDRIVGEALRKSVRRLPGPDTNVCVFAITERQSAYVYEEGAGVGSFNPGSGKILLFINPEGNWREWTPYMTAHEYHHSAWTHMRVEEKPDETPLSELADYLVFEGRADSFARILYPNEMLPHTDALSHEEEVSQWEIMREDLDSADQELWQRYAFGGSGTPRWSLYTIGFNAVQSYLDKHPEETVEEWTKKDARDLLDESGYPSQ